MSKHVRKFEDGYLLSPAATLAVVADARTSTDTSPVGKARAWRVIDQVMAAARDAKFEQADILETMLSTGAPPARLLPVFDALVKRVGAERVVTILRRALASVREGGA